MGNFNSKKILAILLTILLLGWAGYQFFSLSDLRSNVSETSGEVLNEAFSDVDRGRKLIQEMGKAHGINQWTDIETYSVVFEDEFYGLIGGQSHPYSADKSSFELQYWANSYDGRLKFRDGENQGLTWGIQSWKTYTVEPRTPEKFEEDKDIEFWLPTYQYFIEFPARIQKATTVAFAGESDINGQRCYGILASWNTLEPQRDTDQYLIWIDQQTKKIVKLEYTVREMFGFLTGAAYFNEYVNHNGLLLPSRMPVESNLVLNGFLHEMRIQKFTPNNVSLDRLRPDETLPILGDRKP